MLRHSTGGAPFAYSVQSLLSLSEISHMYVLKMIACLKDIFMVFLNTGSYFS